MPARTLWPTGGGQRVTRELPHRLFTHQFFSVHPVFELTFKVLRRARTRCNLSLSRGSLALWVKQRRSSCRPQGLGSPRAVTLACSRARYSCSSPSNGSGSRPSDTRRSLPSDTLRSLLSTLSSRRSTTPRRGPVRVTLVTVKMDNELLFGCTVVF